jgi:hypothetical protein
VAPERLPADLSDLDALPGVYATAREGFGFEWYERHAGDHSRSVVVYRFTRGGESRRGRLTWSACTAAWPGESLASLCRNAAASDTRVAA